ncbi:hypothetical protein DL93DRAFT_2136878 [Clavulina sp. PMI_390]|nr:hypothetical protein DL93DRAFT_2136878 [Clavulina sp. PMI_390]
MATMATIPELGPPGSLEVEPQMHYTGRGTNMPKCLDGVSPFTVAEFEHLAIVTAIGDLVVENITHWKHGPDYSPGLPFYHEFITIKTVPAGHHSSVALPPPAELSRDPTRVFDWSSIVTRGLSFRIDRGQLPRSSSNGGPSKATTHASLNESAHLIPIDLVEIMHPDVLDPRNGEARVPTTHVRLQWRPYAPLLSFNRRNADSSLRDDPCALRVRDLIFFLKRHAEQSMVYAAHEWNTWELAPALIRFLLRYRLVWAFDAIPFIGQPTASSFAGHSSAVGRGRSQVDPTITRGFEHAYRQETGSFLDEQIFGSEVSFFSLSREYLSRTFIITTANSTG